MDSLSSFFQSQWASWSSWSFDSLKNFRQISPAVQTHLLKIYLTLCCALIASAFGHHLHILWNIGGFLTTLGFMISLFWISMTPTFEEQKRVKLFMVGAVFEGASNGPLIDLAIKIGPSIMIITFVGTAVALGYFLIAATSARRIEYLYLGGVAISSIFIIFWLHFASYIFGAFIRVFMFEIYIGLLVYVGCTVVDNQEIIEKAHLGDMDYVQHALALFTNFGAVFYRFPEIMLNSRELEKKKKENSSSSSSS